VHARADAFGVERASATDVETIRSEPTPTTTLTALAYFR